MGSDESHLMFQKEVMDSHKTTTFLKRREIRSGIDQDPSTYQPNALLLGQIGSSPPPPPLHRMK